MRHEIGDKIKIKTWKELKKEFGELCQKGSNDSFINTRRDFFKFTDIDIGRLKSKRVLTIKRIHKRKDFIEFEVEELSYFISSEWIKEVESKSKSESQYINDRFEILDL